MKRNLDKALIAYDGLLTAAAHYRVPLPDDYRKLIHALREERQALLTVLDAAGRPPGEFTSIRLQVALTNYRDQFERGDGDDDG